MAGLHMLHTRSIVLFGAILEMVACSQISIFSSTLVAYDLYNVTSNYLLGLSAYAGIGPLKNDSYLQQLNKNLGVNVLGYGEQLNGILPADQQQAIACCDTVAGLKQYIDDGEACKHFKSTFDPSIWNSAYYKQNTSLITFIYLKDSCQSGYEPEDSHCFGPDTGGGTPNNADGWWTQLMLGFVNCTQQLNEKLAYYHIWNEPNAHFWKYGKNGTYYAEFYYNVTKAIKQYYPRTLLSGPVTWDPPLYSNTWEDYYVSLMHKIVVEENRKDLLDYLDFHAYDNGASNLSAWDYVVSSLHAISLYYNIISNGENIRTHITETNVELDEANNTNDEIHWNLRTMENAKQILALSFNSDKFGMRHLFDLGAATFNFYESIDYYMHEVMKPILNGYMVHFEYINDEHSGDGFPRYDSGNGVMSQIVYHDDNRTVTVLLINDNAESQELSLVDSDRLITWQDTARMATQQGVNNKWNVTITAAYNASVKMLPFSVMAVTGYYAGDTPQGRLKWLEFGCNAKSEIMRIIGNSTEERINISIAIRNAPNAQNIHSAFIKFGFVGNALLEYTWNVNVTANGNVYLNKQNFISVISYNELPISSDSFLNEINNGNTIMLSFEGTRNRQKDVAAGPSRLVFASLMVGYLD